MDLSGILTITGKPGLYKILTQVKDGIVTTSLLDGKRTHAKATDRISALEDISIFTNDGDEPLKDVFAAMARHNDVQEINEDITKNKTEMIDYFESIVPEFDQDRVYPSDIKKVIKWYNLLLKNQIITSDNISESSDNEENNSIEDAEVVEEDGKE